MEKAWELEEWKESVSSVIRTKEAFEKSIEELTAAAHQVEKSSNRLELLEALAENVAKERLLSRLEQDTKFEQMETERLLQDLESRK